jgi:signal transduction histidine kinase
MVTDNDGAAAMTAERAQRLARLLRHEVGDLLQSVYSTVAVLTERLPATLQMERRLVADLKNRAELCKGELDAAVSLVMQQPPSADRIDLTALIGTVLAQAQRRFPALPVQFSPRPSTIVLADGRTLSGALWLLLVAVCQSAQKSVTIGLEVADGQVECRVERDGYPASAEQLAWLEQPFATTHHALFGLGLALLQQSVRPGGEVRAANRPDGGLGVWIRFPSA